MDVAKYISKISHQKVINFITELFIQKEVYQMNPH